MISFEDILADDEFGILEKRPQIRQVPTEDEQILLDFEKINEFYDKHGREPSSGTLSEIQLAARLEEWRKVPLMREKLASADRHRLLDTAEDAPIGWEQILADDSLGILEESDDVDRSIFEIKHLPADYKQRAASDYVSQRQPMSELDFAPFKAQFKQIHDDLKTGRRKLLPFSNAEKNLKEGGYYLVDGLLCLLLESKAKYIYVENDSGDRQRLEGRTLTIFENGTQSDMLFRSLGKAIHKGGKMLSELLDEDPLGTMITDGSDVELSDDVCLTGWIYVCRSLSDEEEIKNRKLLHKIGFSTLEPKLRVRNARHEATYLYADVELLCEYRCVDINKRQVEILLHRFFASQCLDIDITGGKKRRQSPREWFEVPFPIIDEAIKLMMAGSIGQYYYDAPSRTIKLKA